MTEVEIKKELYKTKPIAIFMFIRKGHAYYSTNIKEPSDTSARVTNHIMFKIPIEDMGDSDYEPEMPAQLLNRWLMMEK